MVRSPQLCPLRGRSAGEEEAEGRTGKQDDGTEAGSGWTRGTYDAPEHLVPTTEGDRQHGRTLLCIERHSSLLIHSTCNRAGAMGAEIKA